MTEKLSGIMDRLDALSIEDSAALVKVLENTWNVKADPWEDFDFDQVVPEQEVQIEKQTEFDVELTSFPSGKKIHIIKSIRVITGASLREAKEIVEEAPKIIKEAISETDAEEIKRMLEADGAEVTIK